MKLHLGCGTPGKLGYQYWPGYTNHDAEVDLKQLPYEENSIAEISCIHLFEHLPRLEVQEILKEWSRVLEPNGLLVMEMPSLDKIANLIVNGEKNIRLTLLGIFGDPRDWKERPKMRHEWAWGNEELQLVLGEFFHDIQFEEPVFHIPQRDLRVTGLNNE